MGGAIFPWEFVIAGATRPYRQGQTITISRVLEMRRPSLAQTRSPRVLYVESAPGPLAEIFEFTSERALVEMYLPTKGKDFRELKNPTLARLTEAVAEFRPDIVHLAGFDTHQGEHFIRDAGDLDSAVLAAGSKTVLSDSQGTGGIWRLDGYLVSGPDRPTQIGIATAQNMAEALTLKGRHRPLLVSFNLENSGPRLASRAVDLGAAAAIGFQDAFDEATAELFFGTFYSELITRGLKIADAFRVAWESIRASHRSLVGSGLVLADSALAPRPCPAPGTPPAFA